MALGLLLALTQRPGKARKASEASHADDSRPAARTPPRGIKAPPLKVPSMYTYPTQ
jgi:hypothetical protein